jgi:hypothetical protein
VANIDTYKHGLGGNFRSEVHSPEITAEFGIDLTDDVQIDTIVVSVDGLAGHELGDDWVVRVDLVFNGCVEVLLAKGVWDNY